jgi:hypothetical protein
MVKYISIVIISVSALFANPGFFLEDNWEERMSPTYSAYTDTTLETELITINSVTITPTDTIQKISSAFFGNNANGYMGPQMVTAPNALKHLKNVNMSYMRLPGGNYSNIWLWDHKKPANLDANYYSTTTSAPNKSWTLTTDTMYALADSIGATIQPCVNYSISRYLSGSDSVEQAAKYAADWVRDVKSRGLEAPYWEIGNENYGAWQSGFVVNKDTITGEQYGRDLTIFVDSMKSANPDIKIGAVIYPDSSSDKEGWFSWTKGVLTEAQNSADYLILHEYFTYNDNMNLITAEEVIASVSKIAEDKAIIEAMVENYTDKPAGSFPIMVSEYNLRAGYKELSMLTPVFQTLAVHEFIKEGFGLVNVWDIANGYNAESSDKGDHGMLTRKHPTLEEYEPNSAFFGYYYMTQFIGDALVKTEATDTTVRWYSSLFSDGNLGFVAVNPNGTESTVNINITDFDADSLTWFTLDADDIESEAIRINGVSPTGSHYGPEMYDTIAPYRAEVTEQLTLSIPPYSLIYAVVTPKEKEEVVEEEEEEEEETSLADKLNMVKRGVQFSQAGSSLKFSNIKNYSNISIYSLTGRELFSQTIAGNNGNLQINSRNLSAGSYLVRFSGASVLTKKIFVK